MLPYTFQELRDRLKHEIEKYGKIFIAFDFDNTIFDYHNQGKDYSEIISLLKKCSDQGHTLILFTSNDDKERLEFMMLYCKHFGIKVKYVNENPEVEALKNCKKPYYNILLDDRSGLLESYQILSSVIGEKE